MTDAAIVASDHIDHRIDDAALVPQVEDLLSRAKWSYHDLTHLACVVGPGGFTSLRVAVALANALSHELGVPSCGIHLSDVYCARVQPPAETSTSPLAHDFLWLHSTKKNELFIRGFGAFAKKLPEPVCITLDELHSTFMPGTGWMGELIPEHEEIVKSLNGEVLPLRSPDDVLPGFLKKQIFKKQILQPWYGRGW